MQRWQDELAKHPIHSLLQLFQEQVERDIGTLDPIQEAERVRFAKIVKVMQKVIADIDPDLAPIDTLNQLHNVLQAHGVENTISSFAQSNNPSLFLQANSQVNASLSYIYQLASLKSSKALREIDSGVASRSFELFVQATKRQYDDFANLTSIGLVKIEAAVTEISGALERAKSLEENVTAKLSQLETRWTGIANQQSGDFTAAQSKRQADFSDLFSNIRVEADQKSKHIFSELEGEIESRKQSTDDQVNALLDEARAKHQAILDLYKLSAKDSVSGGYQSFADREYKLAQTWRYVTVGSAITALIWVGVSYFYLAPGDESDRVFWIGIAKSISITALLLSLSVYASKQSTLHRISEKRARTFSLQVQAFDPFIASLPDDMRDKLKEEMSKRIFSSDEHEVMQNFDFESLDKTALLTQILPILMAKK